MDVAEKVLAGGPWPGVTLVQVTLIAALGVLAWLAARRGGPALRGAVVLAALVGLLVVPALATVAPVWLPLPAIAPPAPAPEIARPREVVRAPLPLPPARPAVPPVLPTKPAVKPAPLPDDIIDPVEEPPAPETHEPDAAAPLPPPAVATPATEPEKPRRAAPSAASILVGVWLFGAALYLARALVSLALLYWYAWRARPIRISEWAECLDSLPDHDGRLWVALRESRGGRFAADAGTVPVGDLAPDRVADVVAGGTAAGPRPRAGPRPAARLPRRAGGRVGGVPVLVPSAGPVAGRPAAAGAGVRGRRPGGGGGRRDGLRSVPGAAGAGAGCGARVPGPGPVAPPPRDPSED